MTLPAACCCLFQCRLKPLSPERHCHGTPELLEHPSWTDLVADSPNNASITTLFLVLSLFLFLFRVVTSVFTDALLRPDSFAGFARWPRIRGPFFSAPFHVWTSLIQVLLSGAGARACSASRVQLGSGCLHGWQQLSGRLTQSHAPKLVCDAT